METRLGLVRSLYGSRCSINIYGWLTLGPLFSGWRWAQIQVCPCGSFFVFLSTGRCRGWSWGDGCKPPLSAHCPPRDPEPEISKGGQQALLPLDCSLGTSFPQAPPSPEQPMLLLCWAWKWLLPRRCHSATRSSAKLPPPHLMAHLAGSGPHSRALSSIPSQAVSPLLLGRNAHGSGPSPPNPFLSVGLLSRCLHLPGHSWAPSPWFWHQTALGLLNVLAGFLSLCVPWGQVWDDVLLCSLRIPHLIPQGPRTREH